MPTTEELAAEARAQQAQHEAGHAIASWAQGIPFADVALSSKPHGVPVTVPRPSSEVPTTRGQRFLIGFCGGIADQQRRGLVMRDSEIVNLVFGDRADGLFEIDNPATGRVMRIARAPAVRLGLGCLSEPAAILPTVANGKAECVRMWCDSERFVAGHRPAIDSVAAALLAKEELSYDEVAKIAAAAMAGKPAPEVPWWAPRPGTPSPANLPPHPLRREISGERSAQSQIDSFDAGCALQSEVCRAAPGLAFGLALAVRPAGSAEVSSAQGRVPKIVSAKRLETIFGCP